MEKNTDLSGPLVPCFRAFIAFRRGSPFLPGSWREPAELLADGVHQGGDDIGVEAEPGAGGGEEVGQGARAAQGQGAAVIGDGPGAVRETSPPDLQGTELGDP